MAGNHWYKSGEWNLICDSCSKKIKADTAKKRWDGFVVCPDCYETRHPQDFIQAQTDKITVPFTRPKTPENHVIQMGIFDPWQWIDEINIIKQLTRYLSDTITWSDSLDVSKSIILTDSWTTSDSYIFNVLKNLNDPLNLVENYSNQPAFAFNDNWTFTETIDISKSVNLSDSWLKQDPGTITLPVYVFDYFAEDYIQTTLTF